MSTFSTSQTPSIPRKGTETPELMVTSSSPLGLSDTLNSPQGDGNGEEVVRHNVPWTGQTPSIPRKGTETRILYKEKREGKNCQTPSIPRKGTETKLSSFISG